MDRICANCAYFQPEMKCSENTVGYSGYGTCLNSRNSGRTAVSVLGTDLACRAGVMIDKTVKPLSAKDIYKSMSPAEKKVVEYLLLNVEKGCEANMEIINPGSKDQMEAYDRLHDKRKTYHCNRCGCTWKCLPHQNKFSSHGMNEDPHVLCANPECRSDDVKEVS